MSQAFLLSYAAWSALALSLDRHHEDALGRPLGPHERWRWQWLGWSLLVLSFGATVPVHAHPSQAAVLWAVALSLSALAVTVSLCAWPHRARPLAGLALVVAMTVGLMVIF